MFHYLYAGDKEKDILRVRERFGLKLASDDIVSNRNVSDQTRELIHI